MAGMAVRLVLLAEIYLSPFVCHPPFKVASFQTQTATIDKCQVASWQQALVVQSTSSQVSLKMKLFVVGCPAGNARTESLRTMLHDFFVDRADRREDAPF